MIPELSDLMTDVSDLSLIPTKRDSQPKQGYMVPLRTTLSKVGHYPEHVQQVIRDLHEYMRETRSSLRQTAEQILHRDRPLSPASLSQLNNGQMDNPRQVAASINRFLADWQESRRMAFVAQNVETRLYRAIHQVVRRATQARRPAFIWGRTQDGKTQALQAITANWKQGRAVYFSCPPSVSCLVAAKWLCAKVGTPGKTMEPTLAELMAVLDDTYTILVDELHLPFTTWNKGQALRFWEILRHLYDVRGVNLVICGTTELARLMGGGEYAELLNQLAERSPFHFDTENDARLKIGRNQGTRDDIARVAASFGLLADPESDFIDGGRLCQMFELLADLLILHSMGRVFDVFRYARDTIAGDSMLSWDHVRSAIQKLAQLNGEA